VRWNAIRSPEKVEYWYPEEYVSKKDENEDGNDSTEDGASRGDNAFIEFHGGPRGWKPRCEDHDVAHEEIGRMDVGVEMVHECFQFGERSVSRAYLPQQHFIILEGSSLLNRPFSLESMALQ